MRRDAVRLLEEDEFRDVLVAVVGVEEVVSAAALEDERSRRDRLGRVPREGKFDEVVRERVEPLDAEVAVVYEAVVPVGDRAGALDVLDAPPHAVEEHLDIRAVGCARPVHRAVFGVVCHLPHAGFGLDERLVAVEVVLGLKIFTQSRRVAKVGYLGVLVERVGDVGAVRAEVERRNAVADVVVRILILCVLCVLCGGNEFVAVVVAVIVRPGLAHHRAGARDGDAPAGGVVLVVVLRYDAAVDVVPYLRQQVALRLVFVVRRAGDAVLEAAF